MAEAAQVAQLQREVRDVRREVRELRELVNEVALGERGEHAVAEQALRVSFWADQFRRRGAVAETHPTMAARTLLVFLAGRGRPIAKAALVEALQLGDYEPGLKLADSALCYLRRSLSSVGFDGFTCVETVRGFGYVMRPAAVEALAAYELQHRRAGA